MYSKMVVAAGLLSKAYAQSVSTVYSDIYIATTTIVADCGVCTTNAVPQSYTVIVPDGTTRLVGAGAQASPTGTSSSSSSSSTCGFSLAVNGVTSLTQISDGQIQAANLGQISDGQIQAGSGLAASTFTLTNDMVYDQAGRICSISGQGQSQFQCNYVPTTGSTTTSFSLSGGNLAFNGNTQFYACLLGGEGDGYNIYQTLTGNQNGCTPITLVAQGATECYTDDEQDVTATATATAAVGTPVYYTDVAQTATPATTAAQTTAALPTVSQSATVPVSYGAASTVSSQSVSALLVAISFAYFLI